MGSIMVDDLSVPPEIAELMHREELLRRAGEQLIEEADMIRAKYEAIIGQWRAARERNPMGARQPDIPPAEDVFGQPAGGEGINP